MYIFLLLHFVYLLCVCIYVCAFTVCCVVLWRSKDNLQEFFLFFHHMGPGDPTQVMKTGGKYLYLPAGPLHMMCMENKETQQMLT